MRWVTLLLIVFVYGCARDGVGVGVGVGGGYICNLKNPYIELQRLSFDVPGVFLNRPCSKFVDYSDHKPGDWFSVGGELKRRSTKVVYADVFSFGLRVDGGRTQTKLKHYLPPQDFVDFSWDQSMDGVGAGLARVTWVEQAEKKCARLDYVISSQLMQKRMVEYWCWDESSEVGIPFTIRAYEVVAPGEPWQVDLERAIFDPVFSSLQFNPLTEEYKQAIRREKSTLCGRHIKSYTERGVGWLTGATVERKWTPVFLKMCGYGSSKASGTVSAQPPPH